MNKIKSTIKLASLLLFTSLFSINAMEDLTENMEQLSLKPRLCDDMLREVFSNIDNQKDFSSCARVCRSWNNLIHQNSGLHTLDLRKYPQIEMTNEVLAKFIKAFPNVRAIKLPANSELTDDFVSFLPRCLEFLDLGHGHQITHTGLNLLAKRCPHLMTLHLGSNTRVQNYFLKFHLPQLIHTLDLGMCSGVEKQYLPILSLPLVEEDYPNLQDLNFAQSSTIQDYDLGTITQKCPNLQSLAFGKYSSITNDGLKHLAIGLKNLYLGERSKISDDGLQDLPPLLELLHLGDVSKVTNNGLIFLPNSLLTLYLGAKSNITNDGFSNLPTNLEVLYLGSGSKLTYKGLAFIANRCHNLRILHLGGAKISMYGAKHIFKIFTNLQHLITPSLENEQIEKLKTIHPNIKITHH